MLVHLALRRTGNRPRNRRRRLVGGLDPGEACALRRARVRGSGQTDLLSRGPGPNLFRFRRVHTESRAYFGLLRSGEENEPHYASLGRSRLSGTLPSRKGVSETIQAPRIAVERSGEGG